MAEKILLFQLPFIEGTTKMSLHLSDALGYKSGAESGIFLMVLSLGRGKICFHPGLVTFDAKTSVVREFLKRGGLGAAISTVKDYHHFEKP